MSKFTHTPSGVVFENRKQAVKAMGQRRYRHALANREFEFPEVYSRNNKE